MPRLRISALSWMWVLGKRPPLTKKIFTPSSSTARPTNIKAAKKVFTYSGNSEEIGS